LFGVWPGRKRQKFAADFLEGIASSAMAKKKTASTATAAPPAQEYTVLARRYRPQQFSDLVGQEAVAQALVNALQSNRVAHAYLFTGARGVGKTSTARILAKALNCTRGPTPTPCDECELCRSIAAGEDVDVLEIDGASNRGIDEVREIRQNVQYRPSRARYKIYIIDEVHMLTPPAFNALLKTLEEPPAHVKFIFATTEVQKIPVTILSRCQRFDFGGIGMPRIVERLKQIVASEGLEADEDALLLVARRAGGSMRDAQSLLDQLLAFGGERLTVEQVHALLGTANDDRVVALAGAVLEKNAAQALEILAKAADEGLQLGELLDQLIEYWRDLMVVHCAGLEDQMVSVTGAHRNTLQSQAKAGNLDTLLAGLDILVSAKGRMRHTSHPRVLLEMAVVRLCRLEDIVAISQLIQALGQETPQRQAQAGSAGPQLASRMSDARTVSPPESEKKKSDPEASGNATPLTQETLQNVWSEVLAFVGPMLAGDLKKAGDVAISAPNTLAIRFSDRYNWNVSQYWDPSRVGRIEEALRKITGTSWSIRVETTSGNVDPASHSRPDAEGSETSSARSRRLKTEAMQQPLITRAMEVLGAQIVHMDDGFGAAPAGVGREAEPGDVEEN
jgi:DNA polymerase-3 subunit gamma/tau